MRRASTLGHAEAKDVVSPWTGWDGETSGLQPLFEKAVELYDTYSHRIGPSRRKRGNSGDRELQRLVAVMEEINRRMPRQPHVRDFDDEDDLPFYEHDERIPVIGLLVGAKGHFRHDVYYPHRDKRPVDKADEIPDEEGAGSDEPRDPHETALEERITRLEVLVERLLVGLQAHNASGVSLPEDAETPSVATEKLRHQSKK